MDQNKMMGLQIQMRRNQVDLNDYLRELDTWENDMKCKEDALINSKGDDSVATPAAALPPVRNSAGKRHRRKKKEGKKTEKTEKTENSGVSNGTSQKRISGYDYRSWDKFDVEKACVAVDDASPSSSSSEYETDDEWEAERMKLQATMLKDEGNQLFKEGKYEEAIECYTRGIQLDSSNALLPANRAMALLKQCKYAAAECDCTAALALDPGYVKVYARRGAARAAQDRLHDARDDFLTVLKLEPRNKQAATEVDRLAGMLAVSDCAKGTNTTMLGIVKPIYKPVNERSKKPLRRVVIEEIGKAPAECSRLVAPASWAAGDARRQTLAEDDVRFQRMVAPPVNGDLTERTAKDTATAPSENMVTSERRPSADTVHTSPRIPPAPSTSFQLQVDWKSLASHPEHLYKYLMQIASGDLPRLFGQSLDASRLMEIFYVLNKFYIPAKHNIYAVLQSLTNVKRFSMTVMFLSSTEKEVLRGIFAHLKETDEQNGVDIETLAKKYEL